MAFADVPDGKLKAAANVVHDVASSVCPRSMIINDKIGFVTPDDSDMEHTGLAVEIADRGYPSIRGGYVLWKAGNLNANTNNGLGFNGEGCLIYEGFSVRPVWQSPTMTTRVHMERMFKQVVATIKSEAAKRRKADAKAKRLAVKADTKTTKTKGAKGKRAGMKLRSRK